MNTAISKYMLFEYLSGRANPLERKRVEDWISDGGNSAIYYQWLYEWETVSPQFSPDENDAFQRLWTRVITDEKEDVQGATLDNLEGSNDFEKRNLYKVWWKMAVAAVLLVGISWVFRDTIYFRSYRTPFGKTTNIYLEDGSRVSLNANSVLKVPRLGFWGSKRQVELSGEAEFDVSHTVDDQQFIVKTSDTFQVEVLGTEFSVFARQRATQVVLKTGSVRIGYTHNSKYQNMMMKPGDVATLDEVGTVQLTKQKDPENFAAWKEKRYIFNSTSVSEIGQLMKENFGVNLKAKEEVLNRKITGNFKTENVDELLKTLTEVLDLQVLYIDSSTVYISNY